MPVLLNVVSIAEVPQSQKTISTNNNNKKTNEQPLLENQLTACLEVMCMFVVLFTEPQIDIAVIRGPASLVHECKLVDYEL